MRCRLRAPRAGLRLTLGVGSLRLLPLAPVLFAATSAWAGDPLRGADLYRVHCAQCHGDQGRPQLPGAPDFTSPTTLLKSDPTLLASVRAGKGAMPAYAGVLRDRDILDIVTHLRTLR